uniref:Uncharacterized protein n=1 Tax=Romanomermis culicivorax TaxID=13658 RepID=A0A915HZ17_ROMCU
MTYYGEFHGGIVGRIHATDKDPHDKLSFSIQSIDHKVHPSLETTRRRREDDYLKELFAVHPDEGTISAAAGLPVGDYKLNISAHDGTFHGSAEAYFNVKKITNDMLSASLVAELSEIDAHAFVRSNIDAFVGSLANSLGVRHQYVYLLSVQDRYPIDSSSLTSDILPSSINLSSRINYRYRSPS